MKWQKIDELDINKRKFVHSNDNIFYLREYRAGQGFTGGDTNQLISNLQKGVNCSEIESYYRTVAINHFSHDLRNILTAFKRNAFITSIPPRHSRNDPNYDDRLDQVIDKSISGNPSFKKINIIENINTRPELKTLLTRSPNALKPNLKVNDIDFEDINDLIIIDDTLVSGCSIRAISELLNERYHSINLWYFIWAKAIWEDID